MSVRVPKYRLHRATGQAVVTIAGKDFYLGKHGTLASRQRYQELLAEYLGKGGLVRPAPGTVYSVADVAAGHLGWAKIYYQNGESTPQTSRIETAFRFLLPSHGHVAADKFGPSMLRAVRQSMIEAELSRTYINRLIDCLKRCFKWAAGEELLPASVYQNLRTVEGLKAGRSAARETKKVQPVDAVDVEAALTFCPRIVAAMVRLQQVTGMRSGELCRMRPADVERTGETWVYRPSTHKTAYRGHGRTVFLGPQAQSILAPFLDRQPGAFCFSPAEALAEWRAAHGRSSRTAASRTPGERYKPTSYAQAIRRACRRQNAACAELERLAASLGISVDVRRISHFHPHQLRHAAATRLRAEFGLEIARAVLGQKTMQAAEVYAAQDLEAARRAMMKMG